MAGHGRHVHIASIGALFIEKAHAMSSFSIYIVGMLILIGGLAYGAHLAGLAPQWIAVGVVVLLGLAIVKAVSRTRRPDPPAH